MSRLPAPGCLSHLLIAVKQQFTWIACDCPLEKGGEKPHRTDIPSDESSAFSWGPPRHNNCLVETNVTLSSTISKSASVHHTPCWFLLPPNVKVSLFSLPVAKFFVKWLQANQGQEGYQTGGLWLSDLPSAISWVTRSKSFAVFELWRSRPPNRLISENGQFSSAWVEIPTSSLYSHLGAPYSNPS